MVKINSNSGMRDISIPDIH